MTRRSRGAFAVPAVFAALVLATFAAFFVTTKLKRSPAVVEQLQFRRHFSPNGDGRLDSQRISFRLRRSDDATVAIVTPDNDQVATLADDVRLEQGRHRFVWDGRNDAGVVVRDGEYHVLVRLRHQGRAIKSPRKLFVDTTPPRSVVRSVSPDAIYPGTTEGVAHLRFVGPMRKAPTLLVYRTGGGPPKLVARRRGRKGSGKINWNGRVGLASQTRKAPPGNYLFVVRTRDAAGNDGRIGPPPSRDQVEGHPGVVVRYLAAVAPRHPARAGASARFVVLAAGRKYRWNVRRLGSRRSIDRGSSRAARLRVHLPRSTRSGVALLELRLGARRYSTPFTVQGRARAKRLLLLPATTWLARDPLDSNGDGYADLLPVDRVVPASRPIAGDGLPAGFTSEIAPLLDFLDRQRLDYDVATDLTPGVTSSFDRYDGVLFVAAPRVVLTTVSDALEAGVRSGKTVAWIGTGGFTLAARAVKDSLVRAPSQPGRNVFGERLRLDPAGGLLAVDFDRVGLFAGVPATFGPFGGTEGQIAPPRGSARRAAAGPLDQGAAISAYDHGNGLVVRVGVQGFGRSLTPGAGLESSARIMRNLWKLLRS